MVDLHASVLLLVFTEHCGGSTQTGGTATTCDWLRREGGREGGRKGGREEGGGGR